jgi:hypothetical protein
MLLGATSLGPSAAFAGGGFDGGKEYSQGGHQDGHDEGGQSVKGGDQYADQSNSAEVRQDQENKNFNFSPAFSRGQRSDACGCDYGKSFQGEGHSNNDGPSTMNFQGNWNHSDADVDQDNDIDQGQAARQASTSSADGEGYWKHGDNGGDQAVKGGDQKAGQSNSATVGQDQTNKNFNLSPALDFASGKEGCGCESKHSYDKHGRNEGASTSNGQVNSNRADADIDQDNDADQSQRASQSSASGGGEPIWHKSKGGMDQALKGGDQEVSQGNTADVSQTQENKNVNVSPAISVFGGDASTSNYQKNSNYADADVDQDNDADQAQSARQSSTSEGAGSGSTDQSVKGGDQTANQTNDAKVGQEQTNKNVNISPAISIFGGDASTSNYQTNHNSATADVDQDNDAAQSQHANQSSVVGTVLGN